jgi:signal transduction histidine kinase
MKPGGPSHIAAAERPRGRAVPASLPAPALGLRLLALAAVAGSGAFLPLAYAARNPLVAGILAGVLLGFAQYGAARRRLRVPGELFVLAQVAVWTYLLHVSGGQRSPLFLGFLLEVPLSAALLSRRGCVLAGAAGAVAYLGSSALLHPPLDRSSAALALGFLAVTVVLTWLLIEVLERQQGQIESSQAALGARAENLAEELRLLGDYLSGALVGLDDMGRVVSLNRAAVELLGVDKGGALGRAWQEVLRLDPEGARSVLRVLAEAGAQRGLRMVVERADGLRIGVEGELWVSPSAQGRRTYLLLGTAPQESGGGDPLRRLGEAVACVSHQIKNSLHALQGFVQEIETEIGGGSDSTRHFLRALQSLGHLADDVLAMSGAPRPAGESVPLGAALSTAIMLARHPHVQVQVASPPHELHVRAHRGQLVHALFNLLDNACRVSPPGHVVQVRAGEEAGRVVVEIRDGGPGLPAGLDNLGGPAPSRDGSGYGLLAARRFLEANGGELTFERLDGGGTLSRIVLEAGAAPAPRPAEA